MPQTKRLLNKLKSLLNWYAFCPSSWLWFHSEFWGNGRFTVKLGVSFQRDNYFFLLLISDCQFTRSNFQICRAGGEVSKIMLYWMKKHAITTSIGIRIITFLRHFLSDAVIIIVVISGHVTIHVSINTLLLIGTCIAVTRNDNKNSVRQKRRKNARLFIFEGLFSGEMI